MLYDNNKVFEWEKDCLDKIEKLLSKEEFTLIKDKKIYDVISWIFFNPLNEYSKICERLKKNIFKYLRLFV